jgi:hypothetical protein
MRLPWRDDRDARRFLSGLAQTACISPQPAATHEATRDIDRSQLAAWLAWQSLGALGFARALSCDPELATLLKDDAVQTAVLNLSHFETLNRVELCFQTERIEMVLLKGAAIASHAYADRSLRPMVDLDIWVRDGDMPRASQCLLALGFREEPETPARPQALQRLAGGEVVFRDGNRGHGLVELHYGAFQGGWIRRAANPDADGVWARTEPLGPGRHARRLASEDAILQTAFHVAVNQFGQSPIRGLMDLAVIARAHPVEWDTVVDRANLWRLRTATWLVLDVADRLIGLPGAEAAISRLRPRRAKRSALRALVTPRAILSGRDLTRKTRRHVFMLALVDRPRDGARLVGRTLWPERWWIDARYGRRVSRVGHLWGLLRRGGV